MAGPPAHVEPVAGTDFGLAYAVLPPLTSGQAVGALVVGIGSILVALVTICFGLLGASRTVGARSSPAPSRFWPRSSEWRR